jgi:cytochrome P450
VALVNPFRLLTDPIGFFTQVAAEQGPVARFQFGSQEFVLLNEPAMIEELLLRQAGKLEKFPRIDRTRGLFGEGLLTSEEPLHMRQRRLAQPAFQRERLGAYADEMVAATGRLSASWREGEEFDAAHAMGKLALDIVSRTLFSTRTDAEAEKISESLDTVIRTLNHLVMPWGNLLIGLPTPVRQRYRAALKQLDQIVYGLIQSRRQASDPGTDLLGLLMAAKDQETGEGMPDLQLRDEVMTLFVAGHDTTANGLAWTLYLLAKNPEQRARLEAEVDEVLGGKPASMEDAARLKFTAAVFRESLRLYPPVWILGRRALENLPPSALALKKGTIILVCMAVLHRQARWFPAPEMFDPGRAEPAHRYAYLPFGAGGRLCIGERFAWLEGILCLATLAQQWRLDLAMDRAVKPEALLTLRPRGGLPMVARRR